MGNKLIGQNDCLLQPSSQEAERPKSDPNPRKISAHPTLNQPQKPLLDAHGAFHWALNQWEKDFQRCSGNLFVFIIIIFIKILVDYSI
jgi:hypothetical protein